MANFLVLTFLKNFKASKALFAKIVPIFCQLILSFVEKYKFDLRVIFDQWPKLHLGLDVRPEIPILKDL